MGFNASCKNATSERLQDIADKQAELLDKAKPILWIPSQAELIKILGFSR